MTTFQRLAASLSTFVLAAVSFGQIEQYDSSQARKVVDPREMTYLVRQYTHSSMQIWDERQNVPVPANIRVDIAQPGTYRTWQDLGDFTIRPGTVVGSSILYFGYDGGGVDTTVTFSRKILGIVVTSDFHGEDRLLLSDGAIPPGVPYQNLPHGHVTGRGLEMPKTPATADPRLLDSYDWIEVSDYAVTVHFRVRHGADQIRVITDATDGASPPQPAQPTIQGYQPIQIQASFPSTAASLPVAPPSWNFGLSGTSFSDPLYQTGSVLIYPQSIVKGISFGRNVPILTSGYRIGYVQADAGFLYPWGGYAYWPYTQVAYSPWYYYPSLPPYINLSYAYLQTPAVYVNPTPYAYVMAESGKAMEPLDQAINDILVSFNDTGANPIDGLLPADGYIAIYLGGVYRYSIAESGFSTMLDDLLKGVKTSGFQILSVDRFDGGSVLVLTSQDAIDPWGDKYTVYQEFRLIDENGKWVIREFGTSNNPISTNVVVLKHLDPVAPPAVIPAPPVPGSFNFGLHAKVYQNQALQRGSILINPVSIVHGITFASPIPMLDSGFRIGFVQPDSLFKYAWGGYAYWPYDQVVFSPWYFYPTLPPYLNLSVVYTDAAPAYEDPIAYKWVQRASGGTYTPLDDAIEGIVAAYHGQSTNVLDGLLPQDGYVGIYLDGDYRYSLDSDSFAAMMRDVTVNVQTSNYRILSVDKFKDESVLVVAEHVIIDPWGRKSWIYQSFRLEEEDGKWVIREFGTSDKPLT